MLPFGAAFEELEAAVAEDNLHVTPTVAGILFAKPERKSQEENSLHATLLYTIRCVSFCADTTYCVCF